MMPTPYILCTDATVVSDEIIADNVERYDDIPTVFITPIDIESDISLNIYTAPPPPPPPPPIVLQTPTTSTTQSKQCTCNLCVYLSVFYCSILLIIFVILLILFM